MVNSWKLVAVAMALALTTSATFAQEQSLKEAFAEEFLMGAALSEDQVMGEVPQAIELVERHFNSITPENLLKWESVHPQPENYNFAPADAFVEFGEKNDMFIVGHTLVWHNQTPDWVFTDDAGVPLAREAFLERMRKHIHTVAGRYQGRIDGWDVVNEAVAFDDSTDTEASMRKTKWFEQVGPDYVEHAFRFAHEAAPDCELYYNDYDEWKPAKMQKICELVRTLQEKNIRIDGVGLQGHWGLNYPSLEEIENMFDVYGKLGVKLMITELDINVLPQPRQNEGADVTVRWEDQPEFNPYPDGLPDDVQQQLTERYREIFRLFYKHRDKLTRVTFWGVDDGQSWRNYWPIRGRTNYPLLFDRSYEPKPAFDAVIQVTNEVE